jgi:hypothetical protein
MVRINHCREHALPKNRFYVHNADLKYPPGERLKLCWSLGFAKSANFHFDLFGPRALDSSARNQRNAFCRENNRARNSKATILDSALP